MQAQARRSSPAPSALLVLVLEVLVVVVLVVVLIVVVVVVLVLILGVELGQVLALQGGREGEPLAQRCDLGSHLGQGGDEVIHHVCRRSGAAVGTLELLAPVDEILSVDLEGALALLTGEVERHGPSVSASRRGCSPGAWVPCRSAVGGRSSALGRAPSPPTGRPSQRSAGSRRAR